MTPSLRKYHRRVWFLLAAVLPVVFVAAVAVLPKEPLNPAFNHFQPEALPIVVSEITAGNFWAKLREDKRPGERQLEIVLVEPLTSAAALVYVTAEAERDLSKGILLGSLGPVGTYRFSMGDSLPATGIQIVIFDPIKNTIFQTIHF